MRGTFPQLQKFKIKRIDQSVFFVLRGSFPFARTSDVQVVGIRGFRFPKSQNAPLSKSELNDVYLGINIETEKRKSVPRDSETDMEI